MNVLSVDYLGADPAPTIQVQRLAYVRFERPDIEKAERFLNDFGLITRHKSTTDIYLAPNHKAEWCYHLKQAHSPRFVGIGFDACSQTDLQRFAEALEVEPPERIDEYGSVDRVRARDPNGFGIEVNFREHLTPLEPGLSTAAANTSLTANRINEIQDCPAHPPQIIKLGHLVIETPGYETTVRWYQKHLGLIPSDTQTLESGEPVVTFFRMNLGATPTDHHTLAIAHTFQAAFSHAAFEVHDVDAIGSGQQHMRNQGWSHAWGMGRHRLGSQLFDYWSDPWGAHHEHYADGDVFTEGHPLGVSLASAQAMSQWGQVMPPSFIRPKITFTTLITIFRNIKKHPDLTLKKLAAIAKVMT
ncbi:MAG: hypothetical protein RI942_2593 [Pseudomonadota bacterium]|jgi:catechol 2,3-dioxygenase-like lactoylglutathione lyase family enzyme